MSKHAVKMDTNKVVIDLGDNRKLNIRNDSVLGSISVDYSRDGKALICLNGIYGSGTMVRIIDILNYSLNDVAELVYDLVMIKKPRKLYLESNGIGIGVLENVIPMLKEKNIILSQTGDLIYNLNDRYYKIQ